VISICAIPTAAAFSAIAFRMDMAFGVMPCVLVRSPMLTLTVTPLSVVKSGWPARRLT